MDDNGAAVVQVGQSGENLKSKTILKIKKEKSLNKIQSFSMTL